MARAHRFHAALADVSHNARTGSIEVVHTLMTHDLDQLILNLYQHEPDWADPEDEALLQRYLQPRFALLDAHGQALPLQWLGIRVNLESLMVYQELPRSGIDRVRAVRNAILVDFLPDQGNTVNIGGRSLSFNRQTTELALP